MVKKGNERIMITLDEKTLSKLLYLCKFFDLSKTHTISKLIDFMFERLS